MDTTLLITRVLPLLISGCFAWSLAVLALEKTKRHRLSANSEMESLFPIKQQSTGILLFSLVAVSALALGLSFGKYARWAAIAVMGVVLFTRVVSLLASREYLHRKSGASLPKGERFALVPAVLGFLAAGYHLIYIFRLFQKAGL